MQTPDISLFNIATSILILVFGFLLNRVFMELDKLTKSHGELEKSMLKDFLPKDDFLRHSAIETRALEKLGEESNKRFDKIDILLEAVRVKQNHD